MDCEEIEFNSLENESSDRKVLL